MKLNHLAAALLLVGVTANAQAAVTTVDFESIPGFVAGSLDSLDYIQNYQGYAGFNWSDTGGLLLAGSTPALSSILDSSHASLANVASGNFFGYTNSDLGYTTMTAVTGKMFNVLGGNFSGLADDTKETSVFYEGFRNGNLVSSGNYLLGDSTSYVAFNVTNVDTFRFSTNYYLGVDNIKVDLDAAAVPEPTSVALTGFGLLTLVFKRRRAQRRAAV